MVFLMLKKIKFLTMNFKVKIKRHLFKKKFYIQRICAHFLKNKNSNNNRALTQQKRREFNKNRHFKTCLRIVPNCSKNPRRVYGSKSVKRQETENQTREKSKHKQSPVTTTRLTAAAKVLMVSPAAILGPPEITAVAVSVRHDCPFIIQTTPSDCSHSLQFSFIINTFDYC